MQAAEVEPGAQIVRKSELAKLWNLTPARISQLAKDGYLREAVTPDNRIDLDKAKRLRRLNEDPANGRTKNVGAGDQESDGYSDSTLAAQRAQGERLKNRSRQLDLEEREGRLVDKDATYDRLFLPLGALFDQLRGFPREFRKNLVAEGAIQPAQGEDVERAAKEQIERLIATFRSKIAADRAALLSETD